MVMSSAIAILIFVDFSKFIDLKTMIWHNIHTPLVVNQSDLVALWQMGEAARVEKPRA